MTQRAWNYYFATGDREPLLRAYWSQIECIAGDYPNSEDMFQVGMMGVLKAIKRLDIRRVKSPDAWVYLNARSAMRNARSFKPTVPLEDVDYFLCNDSLEQDVDVRLALTEGSLDKAREYLVGYEPAIQSDDAVIVRYQRGEISLREGARQLGVSRRQAYKILDNLPGTW